jgi:hypothetical protein
VSRHTRRLPSTVASGAHGTRSESLDAAGRRLVFSPSGRGLMPERGGHIRYASSDPEYLRILVRLHVQRQVGASLQDAL